MNNKKDLVKEKKTWSKPHIKDQLSIKETLGANNRGRDGQGKEDTGVGNPKDSGN